MEISSDYKPLLHGIGFGGYRSFPEWQQINFPTKVTTIAGVNNSGKSNVLRFLQLALPIIKERGDRVVQQIQWALDSIDRPKGYPEGSGFEISIPVKSGDFSPERLQQIQSGRRSRFQSLQDFQEEVVSGACDQDGLFWPRLRVGAQGTEVSETCATAAIERWSEWGQISDSALRAMGGGPTNPVEVMKSLIARLARFGDLPNVVTIASARRIEPGDDVEADWSSGRGIVRALGRLQNPTHEDWDQAQPRWSAINSFVRTVLDDPNASITVPYDFSTLQIRTPDRVLPLSSLGSGVEQVVVLAAAATVNSKSLVCLEEPETNLHPLLQKKLLRYLVDETDNQYVIATHSPHILDSGRATAYHVRLTPRGSNIQVARRPHELVSICNDLGYSPSDLLQANCVVWVEGPSDRIYIRHWLALVDPDLEEGIDYEVMFYGGKLLAHLSASEVALSEFIALRRLNRWSAVVIDSDKTGSRKRLDSTKRRIQDEFKTGTPDSGLAWVTNCYTIENYIAPDVLRGAVREVHPSKGIADFGRWDNPLKKSPQSSPYDKVGIAAKCVERLGTEDLDRYGLRRDLERLAELIRRANGMSTAPQY